MGPLERGKLTSLMVRLVDGDRSAFDPIFSTCWPLVHRLALKLVAGEEAEDVAQTALLKVFSRANEFEKDRDALSWILGITAYECKTARNKIRRRKEDFPTEQFEIMDGSKNSEELLLDASVMAAIEEVLSILAPEDRQAILISINDLERPDLNPATFRKRVQRAMDRLRKGWSEIYE